MGPRQPLLPAHQLADVRTSTRGTGATNVIPGELVVDFNFRFSTESTPETLKSARARACSTATASSTHSTWTLGGEPFLTPGGRPERRDRPRPSSAETGVTAELSTTGGTSDGRFIAKICPQVVEFGPLNATHPQDRRKRRRGQHRPAEEHLPHDPGERCCNDTDRDSSPRKRPPQTGGRFVWARHDQRLRRSRLAGPVGARACPSTTSSPTPSAC